MYGTKKLCTLAFRLSNRERWYKRFLTMPSINGRKRWAPEETLRVLIKLWATELSSFCWFCFVWITTAIGLWVFVVIGEWTSPFRLHTLHTVVLVRWFDIWELVEWTFNGMSDGGREIKWMVAKSRLMLHGPRFVLSRLVLSLSTTTTIYLAGWLAGSVSE